LRDAFASGTESSAIGDLNGDGNADLALVSHGSSFLRVYLGKGDATVEAPLHFGNTGGKPVFIACCLFLPRVMSVAPDGRPDP